MGGSLFQVAFIGLVGNIEEEYSHDKYRTVVRRQLIIETVLSALAIASMFSETQSAGSFLLWRLAAEHTLQRDWANWARFQGFCPLACGFVGMEVVRVRPVSELDVTLEPKGYSFQRIAYCVIFSRLRNTQYFWQVPREFPKSHYSYIITAKSLAPIQGQFPAVATASGHCHPAKTPTPEPTERPK